MLYEFLTFDIFLFAELLRSKRMMLQCSRWVDTLKHFNIAELWTERCPDLKPLMHGDGCFWSPACMTLIKSGSAAPLIQRGVFFVSLCYAVDTICVIVYKSIWHTATSKISLLIWRHVDAISQHLSSLTIDFHRSTKVQVKFKWYHYYCTLCHIAMF